MKNNILIGIALISLLSAVNAADQPSVQAMKNYEKQYEVMMNNVVNANTPGFRASKVITKSSNGQISSEVVPSAGKGGGLVYSGDPLHVGIAGPGYFMIQGPNQITMFTRDGRFKLNSDNVLVTLAGEYPVLCEGGEVTIAPGETGLMKIAITEGGLVVINNSALARLLVVEIIDFTKFKSVNGSFFTAPEEAYLPLERITVHQYYYEASNVNVAEELISMPQISKKFDANSKVLQIMKKIRTTGREMGNPQ